MQGLGVQFFKHMTHWVCLSKFRQIDSDWYKKIITIKFPATNHILVALTCVHEDANENVT